MAARYAGRVPTVVSDRSHGIDWTIDLATDRLLPGRLVDGRVTITASGPVEGRALVVALVGTEQWQYTQTTTDGQGHVSSHTETRRDELARLPVELAAPLELAAGETRALPFQLPVPGLGPATFEGTVSRLDWRLEAKIDRPGAPDSAVAAAVRILQPTALLRAGVVDVAEFALYPAADAAADGVQASIALDPMPVCVDAPITGRLTLELPGPVRVQEVRVELRVHAKATVSAGLEETVRLWAGRVAGDGSLEAGHHELQLADRLPGIYLPTIELPHGRADATVHVILAKPMARDTHLVRDVAICSTTEV